MVKRLLSAVDVVMAAINEFGEDRATVLGAALAFYTALSLAPLLVILMFVAGLIGPDAQRQLVAEIVALVGPQAGNVIQLIIENAREQRATGLWSAALGIVTLLLSATMVFAQLQTAMNRIWNVQPKPQRSAIKVWLKKRLLSLSMMAGIGFLMLVSLAVSAAVNLIFTGQGLIWSTVDLGASLVIYTMLFAMIFKVLPDVELQWRDVWAGAAITAVLFGLGKFAIGKYLGYSSVGSAYGAAGSLVVLLVWVYYSALVVFMGAEIAQVISQRRGTTMPEPFAVEGNPEKGYVEKGLPSSDM